MKTSLKHCLKLLRIFTEPTGVFVIIPVNISLFQSQFIANTFTVNYACIWSAELASLVNLLSVEWTGM